MKNDRTSLKLTNTVTPKPIELITIFTNVKMSKACLNGIHDNIAIDQNFRSYYYETKKEASLFLSPISMISTDSH